MAIKINWSGGPADIRALGKSQPFSSSTDCCVMHGNVKTLQGEFEGRLRLRVGDYRVLFSPIADGPHIHGAGNRKDAYR